MTTKKTGRVDPNGERGVRASRGTLLPGSVIGDGRYRLLAQFGVDTRANAQLWRARDGQLGRDVALTVLVGDPANSAGAAAARRVLERAMHAAQFTDDGVARVLDVLSLGNGIVPAEGILGMVVADWTAGTDLVDLIADGPIPPGTAAALLEPLASAVEQAHHSGLVLGVDHPQRVRITAQGSLRLAFPAPLPQATLRDDVKGLGAVLYLLLTGRWPLAGGPDALPAAPRTPDDSVVAPRTLRPEIPLELSNLAVRCLSDTAVGGIRTSAAIMAVLDRVATSEPETTVLSRVNPRQEEDDDGDNTIWTTKKPVNDPKRRRKLMLSVAVLTAATVAVAGWLVAGVISFFSDSSGGAPTGPKIGPAPGAAQPKPGQPAGQRGRNAGAGANAATAPPVQPATIEVFNLQSEPDNPDAAGLAIDGDPATLWSTDVYMQQFPALKEGVGLMATFDAPTRLTEVDVASPSPGTRVQIRTSPTQYPVSIEETQVVGEADLVDGLTKVGLRPAPPTRYLLVWVTRLGGDGEENATDIAELKYLPPA